VSSLPGRQRRTPGGQGQRARNRQVFVFTRISW